MIKARHLVCTIMACQALGAVVAPMNFSEGCIVVFMTICADLIGNSVILARRMASRTFHW
ncbi:MAG TPA: hypothetical protein VE136_16710 [Anaerolineales bacterium]|nr:hypothetical protein [Anaerolineales bacterium]